MIPNETSKTLVESWSDYMAEDADVGFGPIDGYHKRRTMARLLENTTKFIELNKHNPDEYVPSPLAEAGIAPNNIGSGNIAGYDPIIVNMLRRAAPNLMAFDWASVQPMSGPTGLVFAMRARYGSQTGPETFFNEVNTAFASVLAGNSTFGQAHTGGNTSTPISGNTAQFNTGSGMATAQLEALGTTGNTAFPEMAFDIEKVTATAKGRALAAGYTMELAQDLKALHGMDAEAELVNILQTEMLAEINRELVRTLLITASIGAQEGTTTAGIFDLDTDSNGRWFVEKFKGLMFQLEREANAVARETRRGRANIVICSSDVASALAMAGFLSNTPALNGNNGLVVDDTGNTFVGILNNKYRLYVDPYASGQYLTVAYKGSNPYDAGFFYCPYVPLQMVRAVDPQSFQPRFGMKTRYAMVANPFAGGLNTNNGLILPDANKYYRKVLIRNLF